MACIRFSSQAALAERLSELLLVLPPEVRGWGGGFCRPVPAGGLVSAGGLPVRARDRPATADLRSSAVMTLSPPLCRQTSALYYAAFIGTMRREWFGIDRLRMDKFMMLVRKFFFKLLQRFCRNGWCGACWLWRGWGQGLDFHRAARPGPHHTNPLPGRCLVRHAGGFVRPAACWAHAAGTAAWTHAQPLSAIRRPAVCRRAEEVRELTGIWLEQVLLPEDTLAATGFAYHLIDLLIPELQRAVTSAEQRPPAAALALLLEPFCQALARGNNPTLLNRLRCGRWVGERGRAASRPGACGVWTKAGGGEWEPCSGAPMGPSRPTLLVPASRPCCLRGAGVVTTAASRRPMRITHPPSYPPAPGSDCLCH